MVKIELKGITYEIKDYLSLGDYANIYKVKDLFTDEYFNAKLINLITGAPLEDIMKCDYDEINFVASFILSLIPTEREQKLIDRFEIDGIKYGFFPNWRDLSFAEFVDIDTIITKPIDQLLNMLHILAAVMYRPIEHEISEHNFIIEEYDVKTMSKRAELFKEKLDVNILLGAQFFFIKFVKRYSLYIQASSMKKMNFWMKIKFLWKMKKYIIIPLFKRRMDGLSSSTELLEMILPNTTTSTKKI
jgi:hypothetical protein